LEFVLFELKIKRERLLHALLTVNGAVDKKQALPILSHVLFKLSNHQLAMTATDLEIEITAELACESQVADATMTVSAKKMIDIVRSFEEDTEVTVRCEGELIHIQQGQSRFKLSSLSANQFPSSKDEVNQVELMVPRESLISLLQSTHFALPQQDVRIYLNGLCLLFEPNLLTAIATDGHRLAICKVECEHQFQHQLLLPRKGVLELLRLLNGIQEDKVLLGAGDNHLKLSSAQFVLSSKLIHISRFPPYSKAIPKHSDKFITIDSELLKRALLRMMILSHEKSRSVSLQMQVQQITLTSTNEQEEATESLAAETQGEAIRIGFNASYLLDVLHHFGEDKIRISLSTPDASILIESLANPGYQYTIMPMKI
jgi:DNA polymerase-3 subunit beta